MSEPNTTPTTPASTQADAPISAPESKSVENKVAAPVAAPGQATPEKAPAKSAPAPAKGEDDKAPEILKNKKSALEMLAEARHKREQEQESAAPKPEDAEGKSKDETTPPANTKPEDTGDPEKAAPKEPVAASEPPKMDAETRAKLAEDKLAEIEQARKNYQAEQMNQRQYADLKSKYDDLQDAKEAIADLKQAAVDALEIHGQDSQEYADAHRKWKSAVRTYGMAESEYQKLYGTYVEQNRRNLEAGYVGFLDNTLKSYGTSVKELREANPQLRLDRSGDVLAAALKAVSDAKDRAVQAKLDAAEAKVKAAEEKVKEARKKWDYSGAGSRMENITESVGRSGVPFDLNTPASEYFARARTKGQ